MKYKYNIKYKIDNKVQTINFKNKNSMIAYLDKHKEKLNTYQSTALHFDKIMLPLKQTIWHVKQLTEIQKQKLKDKKKLDDFVSRLEN